MPRRGAAHWDRTPIGDRGSSVGACAGRVQPLDSPARRRTWIDGEIGTCDDHRSQTVRRAGSTWPAGVGVDLLGLGISANLNGQRPAVWPGDSGQSALFHVQCSTTRSAPASAAFRERNTPRSTVGIISSARRVSGRLAVIVACHRRMATCSSRVDGRPSRAVNSCSRIPGR